MTSQHGGVLMFLRALMILISDDLLILRSTYRKTENQRASSLYSLLLAYHRTVSRQYLNRNDVDSSDIIKLINKPNV